MLTGLRAAIGSLAIVAALGQAPLQCASDVDPNRRSYEDPGEALYGLAGRFKAAGDQHAHIATLKYLVERYPSSRFAEMARQDLTALGQAPPGESDP